MKPRTNLALALVGIFTMLIGIGMTRTLKDIPPPPVYYTVPGTIELPTPIADKIENLPVVPGGVTFERIAELQKQGFYRDIDFSTIHSVVVDADFHAYVQYMRNGKVYWTKKPVLIKAGELLFCDGAGRCIRASCGNELSFDPKEPVSLTQEPITGEIDSPVAGEPIVPTIETPPASLLPPIPSPQPWDSAPCCLVVGGGGTINVPVPVPEPSTTGLLVVAGLLLLFARVALKGI